MRVCRNRQRLATISTDQLGSGSIGVIGDRTELGRGYEIVLYKKPITTYRLYQPIGSVFGVGLARGTLGNSSGCWVSRTE